MRSVETSTHTSGTRKLLQSTLSYRSASTPSTSTHPQRSRSRTARLPTQFVTLTHLTSSITPVDRRPAISSQRCYRQRHHCASASLIRSPCHKIEPHRYRLSRDSGCSDTGWRIHLNHVVYHRSPLLILSHHRFFPRPLPRYTRSSPTLCILRRMYIQPYYSFARPCQIRRWCREKIIAVEKSTRRLSKVDSMDL
jgi:hypothetical protein